MSPITGITTDTAMSNHTPPPHDQDPPDYSDSTVRLKPLLLFFFWSTVFCAAVFFGMRWILNDLENRDFEQRAALPAMVQERQLPPADQPRLQARPVVELAVHRAYEKSLIDNGAAWADTAKTRARIPVTNAMEILVAKKAFPVRGAAK